VVWLKWCILLSNEKISSKLTKVKFHRGLQVNQWTCHGQKPWQHRHQPKEHKKTKKSKMRQLRQTSTNSSTYWKPSMWTYIKTNQDQRLTTLTVDSGHAPQPRERVHPSLIPRVEHRTWTNSIPPTHGHENTLLSEENKNRRHRCAPYEEMLPRGHPLQKKKNGWHPHTGRDYHLDLPKFTLERMGGRGVDS
jgi:hypothetical protein